MAKKRRKPRPRRSPPPPDPGEERTPPVKARPARKPIEDERPPAPWGSFPLVEVTVLIGIVMLVAALLTDGGRSTALLVVGLALASLGGLELSIREHFGGYRSHTTLLSGAVFVAVLGFLFYVVPDLVSPVLRVVIAALIAFGTGVLLARAFATRAGRLVKLR